LNHVQIAASEPERDLAGRGLKHGAVTTDVRLSAPLENKAKQIPSILSGLCFC